MGHFNILGHGTQVWRIQVTGADPFGTFLGLVKVRRFRLSQGMFGLLIFQIDVMDVCVFGPVLNFEKNIKSFLLQSSEARIWRAQCGPCGFLFFVSMLADIRLTGLSALISLA